MKNLLLIFTAFAALSAQKTLKLELGGLYNGHIIQKEESYGPGGKYSQEKLSVGHIMDDGIGLNIGATLLIPQETSDFFILLGAKYQRFSYASGGELNAEIEDYVFKSNKFIPFIGIGSYKNDNLFLYMNAGISSSSFIPTYKGKTSKDVEMKNATGLHLGFGMDVENLGETPLELHFYAGLDFLGKTDFVNDKSKDGINAPQANIGVSLAYAFDFGYSE